MMRVIKTFLSSQDRLRLEFLKTSKTLSFRNETKAFLRLKQFFLETESEKLLQLRAKVLCCCAYLDPP